MALSAGVELKTLDNQTRQSALTTGVGAEVYEGSILVTLAAGKATNTPAAGLKFAGFAAETKTATDGGTIAAWRKGPIFIPNTNAALTDEGETIYVDTSAADNDPRTGTTASGQTGNDTAIGRCYKAEAGVGWWVDMDDKAISVVAP